MSPLEIFTTSGPHYPNFLEKHQIPDFLTRVPLWLWTKKYRQIKRRRWNEIGKIKSVSFDLENVQSK